MIIGHHFISSLTLRYGYAYIIKEFIIDKPLRLHSLPPARSGPSWGR